MSTATASSAVKNSIRESNEHELNWHSGGMPSRNLRPLPPSVRLSRTVFSVWKHSQRRLKVDLMQLTGTRAGKFFVPLSITLKLNPIRSELPIESTSLFFLTERKTAKVCTFVGGVQWRPLPDLGDSSLVHHLPFRCRIAFSRLTDQVSHSVLIATQ